MREDLGSIKLISHLDKRFCGLLSISISISLGRSINFPINFISLVEFPILSVLFFLEDLPLNLFGKKGWDSVLFQLQVNISRVKRNSLVLSIFQFQGQFIFTLEEVYEEHLERVYFLFPIQHS